MQSQTLIQNSLSSNAGWLGAHIDKLISCQTHVSNRNNMSKNGAYFKDHLEAHMQTAAPLNSRSASGVVSTNLPQGFQGPLDWRSSKLSALTRSVDVPLIAGMSA